MVVIRETQKFIMGSPTSETEREINESERPVNLDYSFAIGAYEITVEQFHRYFPKKNQAKAVSKSPQDPMSNMSWYDAAKFCR